MWFNRPIQKEREEIKDGETDTPGFACYVRQDSEKWQHKGLLWIVVAKSVSRKIQQKFLQKSHFSNKGEQGTR